jgi:hypothetical protein
LPCDRVGRELCISIIPLGQRNRLSFLNYLSLFIAFACTLESYLFTAMNLSTEIIPSDSIDQWLRSKSLIQTHRGKSSAEILITKIPLGIICPQYVDDHLHDCLESVGQIILPNSSWGCRLCQLQFTSLDEHHAHYKSDSHLMKLKKQNQNLENEDIETEAEDEGESSSSDEEEENQSLPLIESNTLPTESHNPFSSSLLEEYSEGTFQKIYSNQFGTQLVFHPRHSSWEYRISDMIFGFPYSSSSSPSSNPWNIVSQTLHTFQHSSSPSSPQLICILILRSGRFAASIFNTTTSTSVVHKVFRRYTVRAKAGGSQSSHDSKGRKAQSVGSQLRRYGEQALREDVMKLLLSWKELIHESVMILISAPKTMRSYLFPPPPQERDYPLKTTSDPRVKFISLQVGKPTYEELCGVYEKAMKIYFTIPAVVTSSSLSLEEPQRCEQESCSHGAGDSLPQIKEEATGGGGKGGGGEEEEDKGEGQVEFHLGEELLSLQRGCEEGNFEDVRVLLSQWTNENHLSDPLSLESLMTLLHVASENGFPKIVTLLLEAGASPEVKDIRNRTPYHLSKDKDTRDAYRRYDMLDI